MPNNKHSELCKLTAERFLANCKIALWEFRKISESENPDVLCYSGYGFTELYEIKLSRADFLADAAKPARIKHVFVGEYYNKITKQWYFRAGTKYKIVPHLGRERYYVCPSELIYPDDIKNGFGLYWYNNGKFSLKKKSERFRNDIQAENTLLIHAFRIYAFGWNNKDHVLIKGLPKYRSQSLEHAD
ncbi:MAG: hypothetical protein LBK68_03070 [Candidatus Margulisbacteria bacterium]|jgi:hypothetical protein|nr:hypothetical protein [Candidatus Margulisiibacteriota bacterium]